MTFLTNSDQSIKLILPNKPQQKFTIGRTPQNYLQILDSTVSKNHALIYYFASQKKYVLEDLGSINGTYVNGTLVAGSKIYLKHNDELQFGKNQDKYFLKSPHPEPEKKGKINFKDYHFELQDSLNVKPVIQSRKVPEPSNINIEAKKQTGWNKVSKVSDQGGQRRNKQKFERAIKIPKFQEFLQMQGSELQEQPNRNIQRAQQQQALPVKKWAKNPQQTNKKGAVKLPQLNRTQLSEEDRLNQMIMERKRQLERAQRQGLLKKTQEQQRMIQERLKLEIQKAEQQQQILRQKYQIQRKAQNEERNLKRQKTLLQQKLRLQQDESRQRQQLRTLQLKQKQESLLNEMTKVKQYQMLKLKQKQQQIIRQLQEQKDRQIKEIKEIETRKRAEKDEEIKKEVDGRKREQDGRKRELDGRKRELELEAEALARQYQNIYKETIKKLKLNIEAEQQRASELQDSIEKLDNDTQQLTSCMTVEQEQQSILKEQFSDINGRNKAFLLYASHLQSKIDHLKLQLQRSSIKDPSKTTLQIKDSLIHSRKLLNIKLNQHKQLQSQAKLIFMRLNISSPQSQQYLGTILQNYQEIQRLKELYFEFLEEEKVIENKWDLELQENNLLQERLRNLRKQIQGNKKKLAQNLNDNLKKLTEQRLHMLKMMYYVPEQKKNASKYLIEQMLNIESQNKAIIMDSQQVHSRITELIITIEDKKRQNQHLSNIIFGNDSLSHHFDNMKEEINKLIAYIENERDDYKVANMIKVSQEVKEVENKIYLEARREKKIKDQLKNTSYTIPPLNTEKNPLVFFGKMLAKKQAQVNSAEQEEKSLEKKLLETRTNVSALTDKKSKINKLLQDYKQKQLKNVRDYLK